MTQLTDTYTDASKSFRAVLTVILRRHGLHLGQNLVLTTLMERDGQTPGEVAAGLNVTTPTIVKMATRMASAGLLVRRRDLADNRLVRLFLTDSGRDLSDPLNGDLEDIEARLTAGLSENERATLLALMDRVTANARALLAEWNEPIDH
ncbi:MarR family winged helix-turn-helix transcriptional regulator [Dactylosporangium darangshiense]|uniref:MarR family winged helix-turn-helix transcriptional regulator n=1 Tax=Dactylosporangium darangshiense TaxID=579108 RepID=A0ABP8DSK5_9ACTN